MDFNKINNELDILKGNVSNFIKFGNNQFLHAIKTQLNNSFKSQIHKIINNKATDEKSLDNQMLKLKEKLNEVFNSYYSDSNNLQIRIVDYLISISTKPELNDRDKKYIEEIILYLLSLNVIIDIDLNHNTSLTYAVSANNFNIVKAIIEKNINLINQLDGNKNSPIYIALYNQNYDIAKFLINSGIDLSIRSNDNNYTLPIHQAAYFNFEMVKYIVSKAKNAESIIGLNGNGLSAFGIVKKLCENTNQNIIIEFANLIKNRLAELKLPKSQEVENYLNQIEIERKKDIEARKTLEINTAYNKNLQEVILGLKNIVAKKSKFEVAAVINKLEKINFTDINNADFDKNIFVLAVRTGNLDLVKYLVDKRKVNINIRDKAGFNVLYDTLKGDYKDIYEYLQKNGVDKKVNLINTDHLILAKQFNSKKIIEKINSENVKTVSDFEHKKPENKTIVTLKSKNKHSLLGKFVLGVITISALSTLGFIGLTIAYANVLTIATLSFSVLALSTSIGSYFAAENMMKRKFTVVKNVSRSNTYNLNSPSNNRYGNLNKSNGAFIGK